MLLDEDPATLIHHTTSNFNITPDKLAVSRINESLTTLSQARDLRLREAETALKKLSRTLTTLESHHAETLSTYSPTAHASNISNLDTQKFRTAKAVTQLEIENERLSSQLLELQAKLQELEMQGVDGAPSAQPSEVEDEVLLKLKVYRSLGIDAERGEDGEWSRAVVRGRGRETQIVNVEKKFSRFFYANYFWGAL